MDIVQSGTLRGFTKLTRFYMSDLDDTFSLFLLLSFSFHSLYFRPHTMLSQTFRVCVLVIERSAKS